MPMPMSRRGLAGGRGDSVWTTKEHTVAWCELPPASKDQLPCLVRVTRLTPGMPTHSMFGGCILGVAYQRVEGAVRGLPRYSPDGQWRAMFVRRPIE
jgi:hypothetical protein